MFKCLYFINSGVLFKKYFEAPVQLNFYYTQNINYINGQALK